jgi:hypothetical protein
MPNAVFVSVVNVLLSVAKPSVIVIRVVAPFFAIKEDPFKKAFSKCRRYKKLSATLTIITNRLECFYTRKFFHFW